jgi:hypothetical protein
LRRHEDRKALGGATVEAAAHRPLRDPELRTDARPGSEIRRKDAGDAYGKWRKEHGIEPVSSWRCGKIMKPAELIERRMDQFYVGIALVSAPRLVVASS